jgi:membrane protease YdiL (CAAX protease family)
MECGSPPQPVPQILAIFAVCAVLVASAVYLVVQQTLFSFVRRAPAFWAIVMMLYPVLSVYPQGIIYRAFFLERYRTLFPGPILLIAMSAIAFSFAHIIFRKPIAVGFTLIGGLLFAWRYTHTNSLLVSSFEHALYGCWMFTIGLGEYFYKGARQLRHSRFVLAVRSFCEAQLCNDRSGDRD